ncbi:hypothetical protein [Uliginosibacterium sp. H1]|uniref:hypothetical protein n=1 Tax=Uliginosibacterium sp. H1 TaxID=3114757 RepID=UPI002E19A96E|nr:hypothetical protein [Uliginosibacterium sp. H1]
MPYFNARCSRRFRSALPAVMAALLLSACGSWSTEGAFMAIKPGMSLAEATQRFGKPKRILDNGNKTRTLEFSNQPLSDLCYFVTVDATDKVVSTLDGFSGENLSSIQKAMTRDEVERKLCANPEKVHSRMTDEDVWDWTIRNVGSRDGRHFVVYFRNDRVTRTAYYDVLQSIN